MRRALCLLTFALGFSLLGCAAEGDLSGDIFIVTNGRENVKLGLVEVRAIPESQMRPYLDAKRRLADSAQSALRAEYQQLKSAVDSTDAVLERIKTEHPEFTYWMMWEGVSSSRERSVNADAPTRAMWKARLEEYRAAYRRFNAVRPRYESWVTAEYYLDDLPPSALTAKTDADGKFTLRLRSRTRYALVASTTREIGNHTERYHWIVWTTLDGKPTGRVLLSNDNVLDPAERVCPEFS